MKRAEMFPQDKARVQELSTAAKKSRTYPGLACFRRRCQRPQKTEQRKRYLLPWQLQIRGGWLSHGTRASGEDSEALLWPQSKSCADRFSSSPAAQHF